ncbi:MAG: hypothetical protein EVA38_05720 [Flavobacteriales bacterium]|nr:MAG: hypothetical protein EVA38_05720 [Flavobacteriales bacterium]
MNIEENNNKFKVIAGVLALFLLVLAVYTGKLYNDNKDTITILKSEKFDIESDLEHLIADYNQVIQDNEIKDKELIEAKKRIETLLVRVKDSEANIALIKRYRNEIGKLKDERTLLFKRADSLMAVNKLIVAERDNAFLELEETKKFADSISKKNLVLADKIKTGSVVQAINLKGSGVIIKNNGKIIDTQRSRRANKIRICFALAPNEIAEKEDKLLYIQVINPKNNLLGEREVLNFENGTLNYSISTKVFYEKEELDVCVLVNRKEEDLLKGLYNINVFDGSTLIATSKMILK